MCKLSLNQLFAQWRIASNREDYYRAKLLITSADKDADKFVNWNNRRQLLDAEIERRAELFPTEFILQLISTGCTFSFLDKSGRI